MEAWSFNHWRTTYFLYSLCYWGLDPGETVPPHLPHLGQLIPRKSKWLPCKCDFNIQMNQPIQSSSLNPLVYQTLTHQASILPALNCPRASLIAQMVKNSPATQETPVRSGKITGEGIGYPVQCSWASLVAQLVKNLPTMWEICVRPLGWEDPLEKGKATNSSILTWRIYTVHGVTKSQIWLSNFHFHFKFPQRQVLKIRDHPNSPVCGCAQSSVWLFVAHQAPMSLGLQGDPTSLS